MGQLPKFNTESEDLKQYYTIATTVKYFYCSVFIDSFVFKFTSFFNFFRQYFEGTCIQVQETCPS